MANQFMGYSPFGSNYGMDEASIVPMYNPGNFQTIGQQVASQNATLQQSLNNIFNEGVNPVSGQMTPQAMADAAVRTNVQNAATQVATPVTTPGTVGASSTPQTFTPFTGGLTGSSAGINTNYDFSGAGLYNASRSDFTPFTGGIGQTPENIAATGINATAPINQRSWFENTFEGFGDSVKKGFDAIGGMEGIAQGAQAVQGLFGVYQGMEAMDMAQEKFDFQKDAWNKNFAMQKDAYDRQVAQVESRKAALSQDNERR